MQRVSVIGSSGAGKSSVARALAARLGAVHIELDAIFHQAGWTGLPVEEFQPRVARLLEARGWVVDGNYAAVLDLIWARADTVIWLDPPRHVVMRRLILRTIGRLVFRRRLWNGNRERWTNLVSWDPTKSVIAWAWTQHVAQRQRYAAASADPAWSHLHFIRLPSSHDVRALLARVAGA
ncbi:MAG: AAA family ATPase [Candidatus Dormiibacterota bacterium]